MILTFVVCVALVTAIAVTHLALKDDYKSKYDKLLEDYYKLLNKKEKK